MNRSWIGRAEYSAEERAALVREFRSSGETVKAFANRRGIKWTTFRNWLYGRASTGSKNKQLAGFQEIEVAPLISANSRAMEVALPNGTLARLRQGADPAWINKVIESLRTPC